MTKYGMTVKEMIDACGRIANDKGWWSENRSFSEVIALCHSELSEALEHARNGHPVSKVWMNDLKPDGILVELADVYIRIADFVAQNSLQGEFERAISAKMAYNQTRPRRHGKRF